MYVTSKVTKKHYNVSIDTLRRLSKTNKIKTIRTKGNHRRYFIAKSKTMQKIIYARVSSSKQKEDLRRQINYLLLKT